MNERMTKIMNYEKRLLQDRMQLWHLMDECEADDTEVMEGKIRHFKQEIEYMESQLCLLKNEMEERKASEPAENPQKTPKSIQPVQPKEKETEAQPDFDVPYARKDLEKTIGKSLMGIFASVLIFISLILFATLLLPYFNDVAKMTTMYLLSFAFLGAGLLKLKRDKDNKFYIALTGCGVGAVYISLLLSNMYFKAFGDITLYLLICIWAIGVCFLSKLKNKIFQVIGQLGIAIAMLCGCMLCIENDDAAKFMALIIFYMISSGVFYFVHYDREFSNNLIHHVFNAVNFVILFAGCEEILGKGIYVATVMILLFVAFHVGMVMYGRIEKSGAAFGIILSIYVLMLIQVLGLVTGDNDFVFAIITYLICMGLMVAVERKKAKESYGKNIAIAAMVIFAGCGLGVDPVLYEHGVVPLMILPCLFLGFYRNNIVWKYSSMILFFIYAFTDYINETERLFLGLLVVVCAFWLIYKNKNQYSVRFKNVVHIVTFIFLSYSTVGAVLELARNSELEVVSFVVAALFNIVMMKSCFGRNPTTGEQENGTVYNIINMLVMIGGIIRINYGYEGILHLVIIITTLIAFMVNARNLLDQYDNRFSGIYVGLKFTILMIVILESFHSANYVISIACFALAILSIIIGFMGQYRSLRVFGLILSMVSIFKLIMVDINYTNTLGNALSFFVSGILCFVISLIYNLIDKKVQNDKD